MFAHVPDGRLECDGSTVLRADYPKLWTVAQASIASGATFYNIGDGSTTFGIGDMRAEFPRGWDNGRGIDAGRVLGSSQDVQTNNLYQVEQSLTDQPLRTVTIPDDGSWSPWHQGPNTNGVRYRHEGVETRPQNVAVIFAIKY